MLSLKNIFRFTPSSTWTRAASMCASLSSTPTPSNSLFFVDSNASKSIILDYFSAAKNYFIKYGELGVMNCAAERVTIKLVDKLKDLEKILLLGLDEAETPPDVGEEAWRGWLWHEDRSRCCCRGVEIDC